MAADDSTTRNREISSNILPTVSRVVGDTIIELVYDRDKHETALAVSRFDGLWNIEHEVRIGAHTYVPYSASNNLIRTECVLLPKTPEHHGDKTELLSRIETYLRRYVELSPLFLRIASHYALLSWVFDAFNELPYLRLKGNFGTGKTRGLLAIGSIMYRPFFASGASTVSPIFHVLETFGGTLVLDEADFRFADATNELVKILNNGTMRGLPVLRTMQNQNKEFNPRAFRVFGPKLVAMRHSYHDDGLESRFISEDMNANLMRSDIPVHLPNELASEALSLRNRLLHYRFSNLFSTHIDPTLSSTRASARINQIALPLLSVIEDADCRADVIETLINSDKNHAFDRHGYALTATVSTLIRMFAEGAISVAVGDLTERISKDYENAKYTTKYVGHLIRTYIGVPTHKTGGRFVIHRDALAHLKAQAELLSSDASSHSQNS